MEALLWSGSKPMGKMAERSCGEALERGLAQFAAENALRASGKFIPWQVVTVSVDGNIPE